MRYLLAIVTCGFATTALAMAPLTIKEITMMLRMGYSNEAILHELSERHIAESLDSRSEKQLIGANASSELLDALKTRKYAASDEEITEMREAADARATAVAEQARQQELARRAEEKQRDAIKENLVRMETESAERRRKDDEKLNARVMAVLSTPMGSGIGGGVISPDQSRVHDRAAQIAREKVPNTDDREARREIRKIINELMRDEAFVRETLK
jgi:hypothetical protein